jgi:CxxC-x17-CxxC domain-containing protein
MANFDRGGFKPRGRSSFGNRGGGSRGFGGPRNFDRGGDRPMFKATCDNCGKPCEVPFRPTSGKPVYCSDCFEKMGGRDGRDERNDRPRPEFRAASNNFDQNKKFDELNAKLDRLIGLLEPKKEVFVAPIIEAPKVKRVKKVEASEK